MTSLVAEAADATSPVSLSKALTVTSEPVRWNAEDRNDVIAGELEYAGGIVVASDEKDFGGWSGIAVSADGATLLAVSDIGKWLSAQILYDEKGRLSGLVDAHIAPLRNLRGKPITDKIVGDAEGLAVTGPDPLKGEAYVSFERHHRIWRYDLGKDGFDAVPTQTVTERRLGQLPANGGIEALATLLPETGGDNQRLLALSEDGRAPNGNRKAFLVEGKKVERLSNKLDSPFSPTDIARLPNGDFLVLERSFSLLAGPGMSLRLIRADNVKPGAVLEGRVLARANNTRTIDNMEGLAVRAGPKGDVFVYVMSDDNFNTLQHTYLMMFRLKAETLSPTAPPESVLTLPHSPTEAE
ncbi:MAG: esterase-like activity of phytase family protein [Parvibaculum sp.]|nr:esterase-like activity of phytase family protein [Parvibaculum sp.]